MKLVSTFFLSLFLIGCAATGEKYSGLKPPTSSESQVYIYRPYRFFQGGAWPTVFINGEEVATLKNGGYIHYSLPPGNHAIKIGKKRMLSNWSMGDAQASTNTEIGKRYFYKLLVDPNDVGYIGGMVLVSGRARLVTVPEDEAVLELRELKSSM